MIAQKINSNTGLARHNHYRTDQSKQVKYEKNIN